MKVVFHALVSDESRFDPEKEDLYITFGFYFLTEKWQLHQDYKMACER